ncbi:hypothetical protein PIB30_007592 [Stylosanthes scabra]|uniref:Uncharacterized protein n=1 Tax=Stylosanthes scabra TaxID=79078 RepID=A0ABU6U4Y8_9FABA|nr:hypothetical protein [Stylosanthes scabra]
MTKFILPAHLCDQKKPNDVRNQAQTGRDSTTKSKRKTVCIHNKKEDNTEDFEDDIKESFTRDDEGNEDLEEAKNTLQVCEKGGITFNEDEDVVLAKLRKKKKKNNEKCRVNKKMQIHQGGLKLSKRLLLPSAA